MTVTAVSNGDFAEKVLKSDKPVLVDFWADWCGPCKMIAPILQEISEEMAGKVSIMSVNADENHDIMAQYNIRSLPTLLLFQKGEAVSSQIGAAPKGKLVKWIEDGIG